jgi:hypothetical protein
MCKQAHHVCVHGTDCDCGLPQRPRLAPPRFDLLPAIPCCISLHSVNQRMVGLTLQDLPIGQPAEPNGRIRFFSRCPTIIVPQQAPWPHVALKDLRLERHGQPPPDALVHGAGPTNAQHPTDDYLVGIGRTTATQNLGVWRAPTDRLPESGCVVDGNQELYVAAKLGLGTFKVISRCSRRSSSSSSSSRSRSSPKAPWNCTNSAHSAHRGDHSFSRFLSWQLYPWQSSFQP